MLLHRVLAMRLICRVVSLLTILDEIENLGAALFGVDDLGDQVARLSRRQSR